MLWYTGTYTLAAAWFAGIPNRGPPRVSLPCAALCLPYVYASGSLEQLHPCVRVYQHVPRVHYR